MYKSTILSLAVFFSTISFGVEFPLKSFKYGRAKQSIVAETSYTENGYTVLKDIQHKTYVTNLNHSVLTYIFVNLNEGDVFLQICQDLGFKSVGPISGFYGRSSTIISSSNTALPEYKEGIGSEGPDHVRLTSIACM